MIALGNITEFEEEKFYPLVSNGQNLLLIHQDSQYHLMENKCGHFGMPMDKGSIENGAIYCPVHGITFDLITGEVVNRPYEQCDPVVILKWEIRDGIFYFNDEKEIE